MEKISHSWALEMARLHNERAARGEKEEETELNKRIVLEWETALKESD